MIALKKKYTIVRTMQVMMNNSKNHKHKWMTFGYDAGGSYRVCSICGKKQYEINFADKIKLMSVNELSEFLHKFQDIADVHLTQLLNAQIDAKSVGVNILAKIAMNNKH